MNKKATIAEIRSKSLDLSTDDFAAILYRFQLESYSEKCLNEMPLSRLEVMLGLIRRLVILGS